MLKLPCETLPIEFLAALDILERIYPTRLTVDDSKTYFALKFQLYGRLALALERGGYTQGHLKNVED
jgi:hypothetical protein